MDANPEAAPTMVARVIDSLGGNLNAIGCGGIGSAYNQGLFRNGEAAVSAKTPSVAIIMGSRSDWPTLRLAAECLEVLGVDYAAKVVSAHRTPDRMYEFARGAKAAGFKVIIAGAGGAAHLPGMTASLTDLPLRGLDSLLSIVQMPGGVPVATLAIGDAGAKNAGILAAQILSLNDPALAGRLAAFRARMTAEVAETVADD